MSRLATVIRPDIQPGRRVVAVSDIHGNLPFLQGILREVKLSRDDVLVLVGDILEKGRDSLATLRYVMDLQKKYTVYSLCGNCDYIDRVFLEGGVPDDAFSVQMNRRYGAPVEHDSADKLLWPVLNHWRERSTLIQMALELGYPMPQRESDLPALRAALLDYFPKETAFLMNLPHILEAGNFIFVHGGVPREDRLDELSAYSCMKTTISWARGAAFKNGWWWATGR